MKKYEGLSSQEKFSTKESEVEVITPNVQKKEWPVRGSILTHKSFSFRDYFKY